jgi:hypothetical protein
LALLPLWPPQPASIMVAQIAERRWVLMFTVFSWNVVLKSPHAWYGRLSLT